MFTLLIGLEERLGRVAATMTIAVEAKGNNEFSTQKYQRMLRD